MSPRATHAELCLVAACAYLSLMSLRNETFPCWVSVLRDVLPDCRDCRPAVVPLRVAATDLVNAIDRRAQGRALAALRADVDRYFAMAAAKRFTDWKAAKAGGQGA